jgi:hypothetical protein
MTYAFIDGTTTRPHPSIFDDVPKADDGRTTSSGRSSRRPSRRACGRTDKNARLLDGPITVRDVNFKRTRADRQDNVGDWRTVLVASGVSASGGLLRDRRHEPGHLRFLSAAQHPAGRQVALRQVVPGAAIATL